MLISTDKGRKELSDVSWWSAIEVVLFYPLLEQVFPQPTSNVLKVRRELILAERWTGGLHSRSRRNQFLILFIICVLYQNFAFEANRCRYELPAL